MKLRTRTYRYLIDNVGDSSLAGLRKALAVVPTITRFGFNSHTHLLTVEAVSDPEDSIVLACRVVGVVFRSHVK